MKKVMIFAAILLVAFSAQASAGNILRLEVRINWLDGLQRVIAGKYRPVLNNLKLDDGRPAYIECFRKVKRRTFERVFVPTGNQCLAPITRTGRSQITVSTRVFDIRFDPKSGEPVEYKFLAFESERVRTNSHDRSVTPYGILLGGESPDKPRVLKSG